MTDLIEIDQAKLYQSIQLGVRDGIKDVNTEIERLTEYCENECVDTAQHNAIVKQKNAEVKRLRAALVYFYNQGYSQGHEDTVEACYTDIHPADMHTYHSDVVDELAREALKDD